jgi:LPXTG-motif cell wall-anchored protein
MKLFKMFAAVLSVAVLCLLAVPSASADDWNRKTVITFSGPVEVPGVGAQTLPAGTYVFKIFDSQSDRHIVQIFNQDETHVFTTILAIPNYRLKTTDKTVISFRERPAGQPEALKAWFYPGRQWGEEFVYAKSRAVELAKETNEPVLATPIELAAAPIEALKTAPIEAVDPKGEPIELAQVVEAPPEAAEPATVAENSLPKTASSLPLVGLMGLVALVAGLGMLISRRVLLN